MTRLDDQVEIACASALDLPFVDASFDAAYSQNVVMNIADKAAFYAEARRVLRPGGRLALSNLTQGPGGEPSYPVPWAETAATSFLSTPDETRAAIEAAGFEILVFRNTTERLTHFYATQRERIRRQGPPKLGIHVFMGERIKEMQRNVARNVEEGRVVPFEILCRKV
jgi:SAM-dependent methyltransferase